MTLKLVVVTDIMGAVVFLLFKLAYSLLISLVKAFSVSFPNLCPAFLIGHRWPAHSVEGREANGEQTCFYTLLASDRFHARTAHVCVHS